MDDGNVNSTGAWKRGLIGCGGVIGGVFGCKCGPAFAFLYYHGLGNEIVHHRSDASVIGSVAVGVTVLLAFTGVGILGAWMTSGIIESGARLWKWPQCKH